MGSVYNYKFDNLTHSMNDECATTAREMQNNSFGSYMTTNFFESSKCMKNPINFATSQPAVFYNGGHEGSCDVDVNSQLKLGGIQTHPKCKISLLQRPFATVPYLGKGPHNPELEAELQQGKFISERKSVSTVSDKNTLEYQYTPQVPSLSASIQNPSNLVEEVAAEGWIRGGVPTKDMARQNDYLKRKNVQV
mgnify:CR=1 FL=1|jgi:hypothetical protein